MTVFQKIKNCLIGVALLALAVVMFTVPEESYQVIPIIIGIVMILYGLSTLWYYIRMARHMVGGKYVLYRSVIVLDIALFTSSIATMSDRFIVLVYLLVIYAFTGVVDVLRAVEAKNTGGSGWTLKLTRGIVSLSFVVALFIIGFIVGRSDIFVYGFCVSLAYSAVMQFVSAFRKTSIVYIQ